MALQSDRTSPILNNTNVDSFVDQPGEIDRLAPLSLELPDRDIIKNLNHRIDDSNSYWNDAKGYDLKTRRAKNTRYHLGRVDETGLYKHQKQYKENQIFVGEESIVAYVTNQLAGPLVIPAGREERHKLFASDLEKAVKCYFGGDVLDFVNVEDLSELAVRDILNKYIAIWHFYYDKDLEEIVLEHVDPEHVILDKNAAKGKNPNFICHVLKRTPEELINEFPDKEDEILKRLGIQRRTHKQMTREIAVRKVWVTHYDKTGKPQEGVVWYFDNIVLDKMKNPNYLYAKKELNLLKYPKKPYIFGNLVNYGTHLIDNTSPLEQAAEMQDYLMRRGRQIAENADKANGIVVVGTSTGLTKDDMQNMTGDPNQKLLVKNDDGKALAQLVMQLQAQVLPQYVIADKLDARAQIGNIIGAPTDFTGADTDESDPKVGIAMIKKNQAAGRQDMMVRALTRMLSQAYQYYVQMAIVWYTENRDFTYDAGDGEFDFITLKRDLIQKGIRVKASKPANPDRSRIEAIVLKLLEQKAISLLDAYKLLQLDNAQQLYDNWAKQTNDPMALARDALDVIDESEAYVAFADIMAGKPIEDKQNPTKEYILSLRKLMINDDFIKAKKSEQNRFIKYVVKCIESFEERMALDEASKIEGDTGAQALNPNVPLPQPGMMPQGGMGMPPAPMPGMPQPPMPPMGGMPGPMPAPTASSVFAGTPIPAPGSAPLPQPGNPASLPML